MLKHADVFAGYGGFSLGFEATGHIEPAVFCEYDPWLQKLLAQHWPGVPIIPDVKDFKYDGAIDILTAGFPCQPHSAAGKRRGAEDDRDLWPETLAAIQQTKPTVFIGENVAGLGSMALETLSFDVESRSCNRYADYDLFTGIYTRQEKMYLGKICEDLAENGYEAVVFEIPALAVGASHRRARLWIIADSDRDREQQRAKRGDKARDGISDSSKTVANARSRRRNKQEKRQNKQQRRTETKRSSKNVAYSEGDGSRAGFRSDRPGQEHKPTDCSSIVGKAGQIDLAGYWEYWRERSILPDSNVARRSARLPEPEQREEGQPEELDDDSNRRHGRPGGSDWPTESGLGRVVNGCPDRSHRLKAIGNGIAPPIAYVLGMAILAAIYGIE